MAHLLFGTDLSPAVSHGDPDADAGGPIAGTAAVEDNYACPHCIPASGKEDHPAGLVDYLGTLPVLETHFQAPAPPVRSYGSIDSVDIAESVSTQLTLSYPGTIDVFGKVTAEKAQNVMSLVESRNFLGATTSSFKMPMTSSIQPSAPFGLQLGDAMKRTQPETPDNLTNTTPLYVGKKIKLSEDGRAQDRASLLVPCQAIVPKALPIARKASLARFLEKRKERARLMAPYLAKGSRDVVRQEGVQHSNASTLQMFYNEFWGGPIANKLICASGFPYGNNVDVEDENWFTVLENSKQASECESAT